MATRPPAANVLRHTLLFKWRGQWCNNVVHSLHPAAITTARVQADQAALSAWLQVHWVQIADADCAAHEVRTADLTTATPTRHPRLRLNYPNGFVGLRTPTGRYPVSTSLAISMRTGAVGEFPKPPHGRIYHVGGNLGTFFTGEVISDTSAFQTRYDALLAAFTNTGNVGDLVVMSYWSGGSRAAPQLRPVPLALPVTRMRINTRVDTQRRRLPVQQSFVQN